MAVAGGASAPSLRPLRRPPTGTSAAAKRRSARRTRMIVVKQRRAGSAASSGDSVQMEGRAAGSDAASLSPRRVDDETDHGGCADAGEAGRGKDTDSAASRRRRPQRGRCLALGLALVAALAVAAPRPSAAFHPKPTVPTPSCGPSAAPTVSVGVTSCRLRTVAGSDGRLRSRQPRVPLAMAKRKDGQDAADGDKDKKPGVFGGFFSGGKKDEAEAQKAAAATKSDEKGSEGSVFKSISKRLFQRGKSEEGEDDMGDDNKKQSKKEKGKKKPKKNFLQKGGVSGVVVGMGTFVGPKIPSSAQQDEKERAKQVKEELKAKRDEQLRVQREKQNKVKGEAAQKAKEAADERQRKAQKEKDNKERQKIIMKAAQTTKKSSGGSASTTVESESGSGGGGVIKSATGFVSGVWDSVFAKEKGEEWVVVCPKTRLSPSEIVPVDVAGISLLVVVSKDGQTIHAISNSCPHLGTPLETGLIDRRLKPGITAKPGQDPKSLGDECYEECLVCPLHNTAFELNTGEVRGEWCPYPPVIGAVMGTVKPKTNLPKFDIRTRGKNVEVRLNTSLE